MAVAFLCVGVEQARVTVAGEHKRDLPTEVHGVAKARVESLAQERWCLVCGIAGKKHAVLAPSVRGRSVKLIDRFASNRVVLSRDPRFKEFIDLLLGKHFFAGLALEQLKFPSAVWVLHRDIAGEARWVADLHRRYGEVGVRTLDDVEDEPILVIAKALPGHADCVADKARRAVAADGVSRLVLHLRRVGACRLGIGR